MVGAGSNHPHALSQSTFHKPAILREWDTKNQKQKTDMKKLIMKLLGLDTLVCSIELSLELLRKENEELKTKIENLENEVSELESPDLDEYVREDDVNDRIESYLNDNDYITQSYCDDEIETKVSDAVDDADIDSKIESAMEDFDIENKVAKAIDLLNTRPDDKVEAMVKEAVKVTLERVVKAMADQQG